VRIVVLGNSLRGVNSEYKFQKAFSMGRSGDSLFIASMDARRARKTA
jgi:hypothetical protein